MGMLGNGTPGDMGQDDSIGESDFGPEGNETSSNPVSGLSGTGGIGAFKDFDTEVDLFTRDPKGWTQSYGSRFGYDAKNLNIENQIIEKDPVKAHTNFLSNLLEMEISKEFDVPFSTVKDKRQLDKSFIDKYQLNSINPKNLSVEDQNFRDNFMQAMKDNVTSIAMGVPEDIAQEVIDNLYDNFMDAVDSSWQMDLAAVTTGIKTQLQDLMLGVEPGTTEGMTAAQNTEGGN